MEVDIRVALIAGGVSLIVTVISLISSFFVQKLQSRNSEKQIRASVSDKVISLRLKYYPQAFVITERIKRRKEPEKIIPRLEILKINKQLSEWKSGIASLILSQDSINAFYELRDALNMGYAEKNAYSQEQVEKIIASRNNFRSSLRYDIGFLHIKSPNLEK